MDRNQFLNRQIREYRLQECIGSGGMGAVFKGIHVRLNAVRAIKVLQAELLHETHFKARFETEAQTLAQLDHPNLVRVYEFFEEEDHLFLIMEYISGESLFDRMQFWGKIPIPRAVDIVAQACDGLAHAHARGIVHRDLSPDNLLITLNSKGEDILKVIDFGIAKNVFEKYSAKTGADDNVTIPGAFIGKVRYCSPEQAEGAPIDHRSDQYSLALILYEVVSDSMPFIADSPIATLAMKMHQDIPPLRTVLQSPQMSDQFESVIMRALSRDPSKRFTDIGIFKDSLIESLQEQQKETTEEDPDKTGLAIREAPEIIARVRSVSRQESGDAIEIVRSSELSDLDEDIEIARHRPSERPIPTGRQINRMSQTENSLKRIRRKRIQKKAFLIVFSIMMWCVGGGLWLRFSSDRWALNSNAWIQRVTGVAIRSRQDRTVADETVRKPEKPRVDRGKGEAVAASSSMSGGTTENGPFLSNSKGVVAPRVLESPPPKIPRTLDPVSLPISVPIQVVILRDGRLGRAELTRSIHPDFDREALAVIQKWTFAPGTRFGQPADIIMDLKVEFRR